MMPRNSAARRMHDVLFQATCQFYTEQALAVEKQPIYYTDPSHNDSNPRTYVLKYGVLEYGVSLMKTYRPVVCKKKAEEDHQQS